MTCYGLSLVSEPVVPGSGETCPVLPMTVGRFLSNALKHLSQAIHSHPHSQVLSLLGFLWLRPGDLGKQYSMFSAISGQVTREAAVARLCYQLTLGFQVLFGLIAKEVRSCPGP